MTDETNKNTDNMPKTNPSSKKRLSPIERLAAASQANIERHSTQAVTPIMPAEFMTGATHTKISVADVDPNPWQPRRNYDHAEITELAASIDTEGLIQPIVVRERANRYELIAGERRLRAHKMLGKLHIEAIVRHADDLNMALWALTENMQRQNLSDYEIGLAIQRIQHSFESRTDLAESLSIGRKDLYRYLAFNALPEWVTSRLDSNPRILTRTSADELKAFLQRRDGSLEEVKSAILSALDMLEKGELTQKRFITSVERNIHGKQGHIKSSLRESRLFVRQGETVGKFEVGKKNLVLTLQASALTNTQREQLEEFVERLIDQTSVSS